MTPLNIARLHLQSGKVSERKAQTPLEVVRWFGAMQAQDYASSLWAIGLRMQNATLPVVEQAIKERQILRTWPMRGTIHFIPAEDARWMLKLMSPRVLQKAAARHKSLELDESVFKTARTLVTTILSDGEQTRAQILAKLEAQGIQTQNQRGYHILWQLAQEGLICFGSHAGKQPTFALLQEWAPTQRTLTEDESLAEICRRYFRSHGPASIADFAGWTGLTRASAKRAIALLKGELISFEMPNQTYYISKYTPEPQPQKAYFLPAFDEFIIGYEDRSFFMQPQHINLVTPGSNGVFQPTIVIDGLVRGTWKRTIGPKNVTVQLFPFDSFTSKEFTSFKKSLNDFENFVQKPLVLV